MTQALLHTQKLAADSADKAKLHDQPYHAHWTPEYHARIKRIADTEWDAISKRYDDLRDPFRKGGVQ